VRCQAHAHEIFFTKLCISDDDPYDDFDTTAMQDDDNPDPDANVDANASVDANTNNSANADNNANANNNADADDNADTNDNDNANAYEDFLQPTNPVAAAMPELVPPATDPEMVSEPKTPVEAAIQPEEAVDLESQQSLTVDRLPFGNPGMPIDSPLGNTNQADLHGICWAPFHSELDWQFAQWVKLRGPSSSVLNELLSLYNQPWVMPSHRAHVSSLTGLMCLCTHLGLSSTALMIVSCTSD
jgi:hypothetical protein